MKSSDEEVVIRAEEGAENETTNATSFPSNLGTVSRESKIRVD